MRAPLAALLLLAAIGWGPAAGLAQEPSSADTTGASFPETRPLEPAASAPRDTIRPDPTPPPRRDDEPVGRDRDRFEWGAAVVQGPFEALGTFGYHRVVRVSGPFENAVHIELTGGAVDNLTEGSAGAGYLLRPLFTFSRASRIRPILEAGPAFHIVVQVADIEGFGETAFHAHAYVKTHAYAGFEALLGERWGLVVRGRFTAPAHRPLDYAQAAIFLR